MKMKIKKKYYLYIRKTEPLMKEEKSENPEMPRRRAKIISGEENEEKQS